LELQGDSLDAKIAQAAWEQRNFEPSESASEVRDVSSLHSFVSRALIHMHLCVCVDYMVDDAR
jgi:hypothetical protein